MQRGILLPFIIIKVWAYYSGYSIMIHNNPDEPICSVCGHYMVECSCDQEYNKKTLIGNVPIAIIHDMADTIEVNSKGNFDAFKILVWHGKWQEYAMDYIHPADELRNTRCFKLIQEAFINAYV